MLNVTLERLRCPCCEGKLDLSVTDASQKDVFEIRSGELSCTSCNETFPILGGVAVLVQDVAEYLYTHVKGISRLVGDSEIPKKFRRSYLEAKAEIEIEHIEEDLESERVLALYLMTHYLRAAKVPVGKDPLIAELVREHWDRGPFAQIEHWLGELKKGGDFLELGCGVGGLYSILKKHLGRYLGVDHSFSSIALARHLLLGAPYSGDLRVPGDLLGGPRSVDVGLTPSREEPDGRVDFVVGGLEDAPVEVGGWDFTAALNTIDMLDEPAMLPALQYRVLKAGGAAIQSCPYIWHPRVAEGLRAEVGGSSSAQAVVQLYRNAGFRIEKQADHVPWLFLKHERQLEIYSVHMMMAKKEGTGVARAEAR